MSYELKHIGNPIKLPQRVDRNYRLTNYIRDTMRIVDLIPVQMLLDPTKVLDCNKQYPVQFLFKEEIEKYKKDCEGYGLKGVAGLRCYLTDETVSQEDFSNMYEESPIQSFIRNMAESHKIVRLLSNLRQLSRKAISLAGATPVNDTSVKSQAEQVFAQMTSGGIDSGGAIESIGRIFSNVVLQGKNVSLPKIWGDSSYQPSLQLNLKFVSPYGCPKAVTKYVIEPLIYLLILVSPRTNDGISFGWPRTLRVNYYGNAYINAGYVSNLSIRRGGDDSRYNHYRQPLSIYVTMTIEPLVSGFGVHENNQNIDTTMKILYDGEQEGLTLNLNENEIEPLITTVGQVIKSFKPFYTKDIKGVMKSASTPSNNIPKILDPNNDPTINNSSDLSKGISNSVDNSLNPTTPTVPPTPPTPPSPPTPPNNPSNNFLSFVTNKNNEYGWEYDPSTNKVYRPPMKNESSLFMKEMTYDEARDLYQQSLTDSNLRQSLIDANRIRAR